MRERLTMLGNVCDQETVVCLIDLFVEDSTRYLSALRHAVGLADSDQVSRKAHSLKGSSGNLGAINLAHLCEQIERTLTQPNAMIEVARLTEELASQLLAVQTLLKSMRVGEREWVRDNLKSQISSGLLAH